MRLVERDLRQRSAVDGLDEFAAAEPAIPQMLGTHRSAGGHIGEIIEGLMVVLEIRYRVGVLPVQRRLPSAGIPRPGDALGAQQIADRLLGLRRQGRRLCRVRIGGVASRRGAVGARLIGRLHRVDRVEIGGEIAVLDEFGRPVDCRFRHPRLGLATRAPQGGPGGVSQCQAVVRGDDGAARHEARLRCPVELNV